MDDITHFTTDYLNALHDELDNAIDRLKNAKKEILNLQESAKIDE